MEEVGHTVTRDTGGFKGIEFGDGVCIGLSNWNILENIVIASICRVDNVFGFYI